MTEIKVDTNLLQTKAEMVKRYRQQHMDTMSRLKKLIFSLNETWKGEAQDAFLASFDGMQSKFTEFSEMLEGYAKLMDTAANELEIVDQNVKATVQQSFNNI